MKRLFRKIALKLGAKPTEQETLASIRDNLRFFGYDVSSVNDEDLKVRFHMMGQRLIKFGMTSQEAIRVAEWMARLTENSPR